MQSAVSAIVLCGGGSTRMGRDKAGLPFGGETLLQRVLRLVEPEVSDVVVAAGRDQEVPAGRVVVRDEAPGGGPLAALVRALPATRHESVVVVAVDTPLLQPAVIARLAEALRGWDAAVPRISGQAMPACAAYRRSAVLAAAHGLLPGAGLHRLLDALSVHWLADGDFADVDPERQSFLPCNTDREYQQALRRAGLAVPHPVEDRSR